MDDYNMIYIYILVKAVKTGNPTQPDLVPYRLVT